ncbi:MAG: type III pantothenate kinase [Cryomorphaceae bacterium]|nr:type III pantothenate kinase [Cryomorphaceae bacterium]
MKREKDKKKYLLAIDLGNTNTKIAVVSEGLIEETIVVARTETSIDLPTKANAIISSVRKEDDHHHLYLREKYPDAHWLSHRTPLFFSIKNAKSDTIGTDRLAVVAGALSIGKPKKPKLIINTGTCITYNYVDDQDAFIGGAISPGYQMRLDAMHAFTGKLPQVFADESTPKDISHTTESNLISGVYFGIRDEIDGRILRFLDTHPEGEVFVTGGYHKRLVNQSKYSIFANSNLLLIGLVKIFEHQH